MEGKGDQERSMQDMFIWSYKHVFYAPLDVTSGDRCAKLSEILRDKRIT